MSDGVEQVLPAVSADDDAERVLLDDAVRSLPPRAVTDLLSNGVCLGCIFRLFGINKHAHFWSKLSQPVIHTLVAETMLLDKPSLNCVLNGDGDLNNHSTCKEYRVEQELCAICLGILQFTYHDDEGKLVKNQTPNDFAVLIAELVKREGHKFESFSLEISIPPVIIENENLVRLYMERKYGSEVWFKEKFSESISLKDAFKFGITSVLENLLDIKSAPSPCRIRLTYTQSKPSNEPPNSAGKNEGCKRRKTGNCEGLDTVEHVIVGATPESIDLSTRNGNATLEGPTSECFNFPLEKVNKPCHLTFLCYRTPIFLGGRYLKFSRIVSQTRWIIDDERMGEASVEEIIGSNILPICQGDLYKFHAAGREDIDVRMLGSGRPFLVEIQNARQVPSEALVKEMEMKINNSDRKLVGVKNLKVVDSHGWTLMREGEAEKQKQYCALVWISRPLEDEDLQSIASVRDMQVLQRTPIRVLHRRSPLDREKIIHWMKIEKIAGSSQYFLLHLCTQAGTYIKEFVHGDLGRTHPSIGSILSCRAEILQLDVTDVKMDCFMAE